MAKGKRIAIILGGFLLALAVFAAWIARGDKSFQVVEEVQATSSQTATGVAIEVPAGAVLVISLPDTKIEIASDGSIGARRLAPEAWKNLLAEIGSLRKSFIDRTLAAAQNADPDAVPEEMIPEIEVSVRKPDNTERIVLSLSASDPETPKMRALIAEINK